MTKILLGHLTSNGDCLYATTVARQIKVDFPESRLTWAISSLCRDVINHNPHVDDVWEVPMENWGDMSSSWHTFEKEAWARTARGEFDRSFMTQVSPARFRNYDGTIRPSVFRAYPNPITVPVESVINISAEEREGVAAWMTENRLQEFKEVVIFECASKSGQSFVTPEAALEVANILVSKRPETAVVLSTHIPLETGHANIVHGGALSMRQTAVLTHHADVFVGCGSGLTVVATSPAAKPLPNVQILSESTSVYASFKHDFEYFGLDASRFLELTKCTSASIAQVVQSVLDDGIELAKKTHEQKVPLHFDWYCKLINEQLIQRCQYIDAAHSLMVTGKRYGMTSRLKAFSAIYIEPFLELDPLAHFPNRQAEIAAFREFLQNASSVGLEPAV